MSVSLGPDCWTIAKLNHFDRYSARHDCIVSPKNEKIFKISFGAYLKYLIELRIPFL